MTLKELREQAKEKKIPKWWNKNTEQLTEELAALKSSEQDNPVPDNKIHRNRVTVNGRKLGDICKEKGLPYFTIYDRIKRLNWSPEKAISTPVRQKKENKNVG